MKKTVFSIPKMDCPSEEKLIRMALSDLEDLDFLSFDLSNRKLIAYHETNNDRILERLAPLNFGASVESSAELSEIEEGILLAERAKADGRADDERRVLKILLVINAIMFVAELGLGFWAQSTGLIADSLDMLADAAVYGISLYAVGKSVALQRKVARSSGFLQISLAAFALFEVVRRFVLGSEPEPALMAGVSMIALVANVMCLVLITRHRGGGAHMRASQIFSANDVIANLGVLLAGLLVGYFNSQIPDLVIGLIISVVVFKGGLSILRISRLEGTR